jgi:hypothetical protein
MPSGGDLQSVEDENKKLSPYDWHLIRTVLTSQAGMSMSRVPGNPPEPQGDAEEEN